MAYYGYDGDESEPALVSAPIENEIAADEHAGEGCDALPLMAARITQTEVPSCVSDQQDANECGAPKFCTMTNTVRTPIKIRSTLIT
jgi:hypothetical protein